ncbi:DegT/DnrJ/EryC1/StrS family aminotransferase [Aeromicrobium chenweiae]|uniref:Erythromycin biosynthesis sensory transduction protein eryC1 n=1 Tax=Aeromicrobium chenweiae TaxID=2079793 RepID=A0A2S0WJC2_9ACTN|nr:DegT/DnrJ/EryC1/StrS family aminotransferase [Aeromicrobium chenweiae]AWB91433.1 erythromycin biosynthesis sensory transduction protein eryC1 [Aeromicrobium chenweiae]TGN30636.1 DegT/DnrJ/EryC1/StrS family aminotransferase [Aeromicrobium chenweiae]
MNDTDIPLVDLRLAHRRVADDVAIGFARVLEAASYVLGPEVTAFEEAFAAYCGVDHCLGVGNGTDAVELALRGCGIGPGDEVIIPANTFVATAEAVVRTGATVALADVTADHLIDPLSVAARLTPATRAVIGVHLYGQMAPMEQLRSVVGQDVALIEDAAQSQGARRFGHRSGSIGDAAATSFYPGKNLGAYGDAGAVTTASATIADYLRAVRNHGGTHKYEHLEIGVNSRLDSLQAVVLSTKLAVLDDWNDERRAAAQRYDGLLSDIEGLQLPTVAEGNEHVWHLYVIQSDERDELVSALNGAGIGAGIHYPRPIHLLPAFEHLGHRRGDFPVTEAAAERILSLPLFPGITAEQQTRVAEAVRSSLSTRALLA